MKKRVLALVLVVAILLASTALAATYAVRPSVSLDFDGTTANCSCTVRGESGDKIEVMMTLWQGSVLVYSWSDSGTTRVSMDKTKTVTKGKSYTLKVNASVNGEILDEVSVKGTC